MRLSKRLNFLSASLEYFSLFCPLGFFIVSPSSTNAGAAEWITRFVLEEGGDGRTACEVSGSTPNLHPSCVRI